MTMERTEDGQSPAVRPFDHRRLDRRSCDLGAVLVTSHGEARMRILNISAGGIGFAIDPLLALRPGDHVTVRQEVLGEARLIVRWGIPPRYGAAFEPPDRTPPGAKHLYDSLTAPEEQVP